MNIEQMMKLRTQALEQFAQVNADLEELHRRKKSLKNQAQLILEEVRRLTQQINLNQARPPDVARPQLQPA